MDKAGLTKLSNPSTGTISRQLSPKSSNRQRPTSHVTSSLLSTWQTQAHKKEKFTSKSNNTPTVSNKCPCCKTAIETTMHISSCNHNQSKKSLKSSLEHLFQTPPKKNQIPLPVWLTIRVGNSTLSNVNHKRPTITSTSFRKKVNSAFNTHTKIGWHIFLKGRISTQWGDIMQDHYDEFHSSNCTHSRKRFQTTLIAVLWKLYDSL